MECRPGEKTTCFDRTHDKVISDVSRRKNTYEIPNWQVPFTGKETDGNALMMHICGERARRGFSIHAANSAMAQDRKNKESGVRETPEGCGKEKQEPDRPSEQAILNAF